LTFKLILAIFLSADRTQCLRLRRAVWQIVEIRNTQSRPEGIQELLKNCFTDNQIVTRLK